MGNSKILKHVLSFSLTLGSFALATALAISPMQQASELFRAKQFEPAIGILEKLYLESPEDSGVITNLAASYIGRGVNLQNTRRDSAGAANDFRRSLYLLLYEWPQELPKTDMAIKNEAIAKSNLDEALGYLKAPLKDANWHMGQAKALRAKGMLPEAFVEYAWVSRLQNDDNATALEAQGDIFTIRRRYDKALERYQKAVYAAGEKRTPALQVKLATAYQHMGEPDKAATVFAEVLNDDPQNSDALFAMEQLFIDELRINPSNTEAHINLGSVYQRMKRFPEAEREYQEALKRDPCNRQLKLNFASLAVDQGDLNRANRIYDDLLAASPNDADLLQFKADSLIKQGRSPEALPILNRLMQSAQTADEKKGVMASMLKIAQESKDPNLLRQTWQTFAANNPQDATTQYEAGLAFHQMKDFAGAVSYYKKAIAIDPSYAEAYANLGSALVDLKQPQEAQQALAKALQFNPHLEQAKILNQSLGQDQLNSALNDAVAALNQQDYARAVSLYDPIARQQANNAEIQAQYGLALQGNRQLDAAMAAFNKASSLAPRQGEYVYYKARLLAAQNKIAEAKPLYEKALALSPALSDAKRDLDAINQQLSQQSAQQKAQALAQAIESMQSAYEANQYQQALSSADSVLKLDPKNANAMYYKGLAYEGLKQNPKALSAYQSAVIADPNLTDALYAQAVLLDTMGQKPQAKQAFQTFLKKAEAAGHQEDEFVQYARTRMGQL